MEDGNNLVNATNIFFIITNAQAIHIGGYALLVTNANGMAASQVAVLTNRAPVLRDGDRAWLPAIDENEFDNEGSGRAANAELKGLRLGCCCALSDAPLARILRGCLAP